MYKKIQEMIQRDFGDYKSLKTSLLRLFGSIGEESRRLPKIKTKEKEMSNQEQRDYYENTIQTLKEKFTKNLQIHQNDNQRIMNENVDLIGAINELKKVKKGRLDELQRIKELKEHAS